MTTKAQKESSFRYRHSEKGRRTHRNYMRVYRASKGKKRVKVEISFPTEPLDLVKEEKVTLP